MGEPASGLRRELRLWDLVFFNFCAVASLRWVAAAAHAGPGTLILWVIAAVFFFLPSAIVVARLSEQFPEEGGMYIWTKRAFGDRHGFLCGWFYFLSNLLYFPSLLLAGVTMTAYMFGSSGAHFADDRLLALSVTVAVLWAILLVNFFGLKAAKWVSAFGGSSTFILFGVLGAFAIAAVLLGPSVTKFHLFVPAKVDTLNFWSQIAFAFVGLELVPLMAGEIHNPRRDLPRAALISGVACSLYYIAGTAAILTLLKPEAVSPMTGLAQAGAAAAEKFRMPALSIVFAALIALAIAGQLDTWIAGNTRLPYAIGLDHFLPAAFGRVHPRWGTPHIALFAEAVASTVFLLMAQLGETVRAAYQILVDMTVIATLIPFIYIFSSGFRFGSRIAGVSGCIVTLLAIGFSALPPPEAASVASFETKVVGGCVLLGFIGYLVFRRYERLRSGNGTLNARLKNDDGE